MGGEGLGEDAGAFGGVGWCFERQRVGCAVASAGLAVSEYVLGQNERDVSGLQEELGVAACRGLEQSISIRRSLGDGLAERERVDFADIASQVEMVCRDGAYVHIHIVSSCSSTPIIRNEWETHQQHWGRKT